MKAELNEHKMFPTLGETSSHASRTWTTAGSGSRNVPCFIFVSGVSLASGDQQPGSIGYAGLKKVLGFHPRGLRLGELGGEERSSMSFRESRMPPDR
jgi:hypothetical protein